MEWQEGEKNCLVISSIICAYSSVCIFRLIKSRRLIWVGYVACLEEMRKSFKMLWENVKATPLVRPKSSWKDNTQLDFKDIGCEVVDCIYRAYRDCWKVVMNLQALWKRWNFLTSWTVSIFSRRTLLHWISVLSPMCSACCVIF